MELVIQIAAGIVLAVIVLRFWRQALVLTGVVLFLALLAVVGWWLEGTVLGSKLAAFDSLWRSWVYSGWSWLTETYWGVTVLVLLFSVFGIAWLGYGAWGWFRKENGRLRNEPFEW